MHISDLFDLPIFADCTDDELQWLIGNSVEETLEKGDFFAREGDLNPRYYIVLDGELQIARLINGEQVVLGTTPRGIMGGEVPLLTAAPMNATARAIAPTRLMIFDRTSFRGIFANCPTVGAKVLKTAAERTQGFATIVKQQEKMAALGKLAAGLAHELNNPAAASQRAVGSLRDALPALETRTFQISALCLNSAQLDSLTRFRQEAVARVATARPLSAMEQSDREEELGAWFEDQDIENGWEMAATFVSAGLDVAALEDVAAQFPRAQSGAIFAWLCESLAASTLLNEIELSTRRISDLVGAIKSYTFMDQAALQEVDLHKGLDDTLTVMGYKLKSINVVRDYDPDLPKLMARGSELNQVWTNFIDNAAHAMNGSGTLRIITRCENSFVMIEVADNGPGIPANVLPRIFEPFFTTKGVGTGTGLGLDICYRIVKQHNGTIEVQSQPGLTRFIVRLPL